MSTYRKVVIARTALIVLLVMSAGAFAIAVAQDGEDGNLMDESGVIDESVIELKP